MGGLIRPALSDFQPDGLEAVQLQSTLARPVQRLVDLPFVAGNWIRGIDLATGANAIAHKLSVVPRGWWLTDISADEGAAYVTRNGWTATTITLYASVGVTVDLWVFA